MKKKLCTLSICIVILILIIGIFVYYHPTYYKFNDRFIIGTTKEMIIEKYGEFSYVRGNEAGEKFCGIYKVRDNTPEIIMSHDNSLWYEIYFENDIAVSVRLTESWYGG